MADASAKRAGKGRHRGYRRRKPGPVYNEAARRLWAVLDRLGLDTIEAADKVGVTDSTVLRWLYGDKRADGERLIACQREFGLDPMLWFRDVSEEHAKALPVSKTKQSRVAALNTSPRLSAKQAGATTLFPNRPMASRPTTHGEHSAMVKQQSIHSSTIVKAGFVELTNGCANRADSWRQKGGGR